MRQNKFTQEQIVAILNQSENGISVMDLTRKLGFSDVTFFRCLPDSSFGIAELQRLKVLGSENRKLKQLVADPNLDKVMLQDIL